MGPLPFPPLEAWPRLPWASSWPVPEGDPGCLSPGCSPPPPPGEQVRHSSCIGVGSAGGRESWRGQGSPLASALAACVACTVPSIPSQQAEHTDHRPRWCPCWGPRPHGGQARPVHLLSPTLACWAESPARLLEMSRRQLGNPGQSVSFSGVLEARCLRHCAQGKGCLGGQALACRRSRSPITEGRSGSGCELEAPVRAGLSLPLTWPRFPY